MTRNPHPMVPSRRLIAVDDVGLIEPAWTPAEVCAFLGCTRRQLRELPIPVMYVTKRTLRYRPEAVRAFARQIKEGL